MGEPRTRAYTAGTLVAKDFPLADVSDHLERPNTFVWVDLCIPTEAQIVDLAGELGLHELAVEDAIGPHQRPKLDIYADHLFISAHATRIDRESGELVTTEVDAFFGDGFLVTVRKDEGFDIDQVVARWDRSPDLATQGASFLLYGLLDVVVDSHLAVVIALDDFYDEMSEGIFAEQAINPTEQRHWFQTRRALVQFHRLAAPMREVTNSLMRRDAVAVTETLRPYFQDVHDHTIRVDATDSLRDLVATIVETNISLRDYRQNLVMKKVTSWAAIIAVPTLITGFYGMNVPYPGYAEHWGVLMAVLLMVVLSGGLYLVFKRKEWL